MIKWRKILKLYKKKPLIANSGGTEGKILSPINESLDRSHKGINKDGQLDVVRYDSWNVNINLSINLLLHNWDNCLLQKWSDNQSTIGATL